MPDTNRSFQIKMDKNFAPKDNSSGIQEVSSSQTYRGHMLPGSRIIALPDTLKNFNT